MLQTSLPDLLFFLDPPKIPEQASATMEKIHITVTVPGATLKQLQSVKTSLVKQGVKVEAILESIGIITGNVAASQFAALNAGPNATIETDESIQIAPPEDLLQ